MDDNKLDELIRRVSLFHGLERDDVAKIFSKGMTMRALKDDVIFYKGTVGNQMYIVLGGKVGVFKGEKCLAELGTGDMFGEMALVNKEPRSATVKAIEASHLFVLSESTFQYLLTKRVAVQVLLNIVRTLSQRLKASAANTG
jgi:CRP-like cAMP-binding protein